MTVPLLKTVGTMNYKPMMTVTKVAVYTNTLYLHLVFMSLTELAEEHKAVCDVF